MGNSRGDCSVEITALLLVILVLRGSLEANRAADPLFAVSFEVGDYFLYEIEGRQLSNDTDLTHNGTMLFEVVMRNSTHIRIREHKHEIVAGIRDQKPEYTEFHPESWALVEINSRKLVPFEVTVWFWIDPTSVDLGGTVSIVGESMTLIQETEWAMGNDTRKALHFQANISLIQWGNIVERFWYDCYYDAMCGFPLYFSDHYLLWEEFSSENSQDPLSPESEKRIISSSSYSVSLVETNTTLFLERHTNAGLLPGMGQLIAVLSCVSVIRRIKRRKTPSKNEDSTSLWQS